MYIQYVYVLLSYGLMYVNSKAICNDVLKCWVYCLLAYCGAIICKEFYVLL